MTTRHTYLDQEKGWSIWDTAPDGHLTFIRKCKETGVSFTGPMMRAIRENRKFQTRRLTHFFDFKKVHTLDEEPRLELIPADSWRKQKGKLCAVIERQCRVDDTAKFYYPSRFGQPGDLLWCKHTWGKVYDCGQEEYLYRCDYGDDSEDDPMEEFCGKWRSPRFMPRFACRELLLLSDIRVQRVGDISEEDAIAEGITPKEHRGFTFWSANWDVPDLTGRSAVEAYKLLWDSIHGKIPGCSFKESPWVWVLTFERIGVGK